MTREEHGSESGRRRRVRPGQRLQPRRDDHEAPVDGASPVVILVSGPGPRAGPVATAFRYSASSPARSPRRGSSWSGTTPRHRARAAAVPRAPASSTYRDDVIAIVEWLRKRRTSTAIVWPSSVTARRAPRACSLPSAEAHQRARAPRRARTRGTRRHDRTATTACSTGSRSGGREGRAAEHCRPE